MSSIKTLLKATLSRLSARIENKLISIATDFAIFAKDSPEKFKKEWEIFQEEVISEIDKIERNNNQNNTNKRETREEDSTQQKIDLLRARVKEINQLIEDRL